MQFFIVLGIMVTASTAYLLRQFWRRSLTDPGADAAGTPQPSEESEHRDSGLRAA